MPIKFSEDQVKKYRDNSIQGTGYLAYRDIPVICKVYNIDMTNVLDLGCGAGRSTRFLSNISHQIRGCDISKQMIENAINNCPAIPFFVNEAITSYPNSPYTSIFTILTLFHFQSEAEIKKELKKCFQALTRPGHLIIVSGTMHLFVRNYVSVVGKTVPQNDGDAAQLYLRHINAEVTDYFWSEHTVKQLSEEVGFGHCNTHYPKGAIEDNQPYQDEYEYPPYYYLCLKKS